MQKPTNPAEFLGVSPQATLAEMRSAFLKKAMCCHPDLVSDASFDEFRALAHSWEQLRWLPVFLWTGEREVELPNPVSMLADFTIQDAFHVFGSTLGLGCEVPECAELVVPCRIELRDVLLGNYKTIRLLRDVACTECSGEGKILGGWCRACGGKGVIRSDERVNFEVPPGSTSGNLHRVPGMGNYIPDQKKVSDLLILFQESLPAKFQRKGVDCLCEAETELTTLALGGTASVEGPLGERVYFKVPPGTQTGRVVSVPGQGFPHYRTRSWGNLQCRVLPKLPALDHGERELFQRLRELYVQRGGIQYRTQGRYGVLVVRPENDSPMISDELVDLAVVLQASGLTPAVDLTGLVPYAPRSVLNALVAVYNRCFQRGQMKVVAHSEVALALKSLQIGALFEVVVSADELDGQAKTVPTNPFQMVRKGKWEVYPMGASSLNCDLLLGTPDLLESMEPQGHPFKAYDLSQVPQVDSFLIGKLIRLYKFASSCDGEVALVGVRPSVARVLDDTGIRSLFRQFASLDDLSD